MVMKVFLRLVCVLAFVGAAVPMTAQKAGAPAMMSGERMTPKPNYDLASQWASAKIGKVILDTAVTPHWLEFSDRFWYTFETPSGRRWWFVDPVKKTRISLWDNAKMAAQLTQILRTPYDAQHLPINQIKFIDNDRKVRFNVDLPNESKVVSNTGEELAGETQQQGGGRGGRGGAGQTQQQQDDTQGGGRGRGGNAGGPPAGQKRWWLEYEFATEKLLLNEKYEADKPSPPWAAVSPDKQTIIFARGQNLFTMDAANYAKAQAKADDPSIVETQLTTEGEKDYSFARDTQGQGGQQDDQENDGGGRQGGGAGRTVPTEQDKKFGPRTAPVGISWSQDNKKFALIRNDQRKVADLWVINALANPRPRLETYKYGMPGEANQPQAEAWVFDIAAKKGVKVKTDAFKDQQMSLNTAPVTNLQREKGENSSRWLALDGNKLYFNRTSRDLKRIDVVEMDTITSEPKIVASERSNTYIEIQPIRPIKTATGQQQFIQWSERDGWGHYYLYDNTGKVLKQITTGEFQSTGIEEIDEKARTIYFNAAGREAGEDPYYTHLYSVNIDTGALKLLTPGNFTHNVSMNDKATFFVDTWSRVNTAPESALFDALGNKIMDLEKTDLSAAMAQGFKFPEPFVVKADDGITDLYGVMFKPFDFDESKKYPIIEYVYPGPQTESVDKAFSPRDWSQTLANVGFIVIEVGNRGGNPSRSKWYHNFGYGNLRDYGVPDKKAAVEQLAKQHPWIDINKVGMWGHSGGGFMTAASMFSFPDFYKVGVSESGNHDNSIYNRWWSEKHDGVKEVTDKDGKTTFDYDIEKNQDIAKNLKGHLLLITGDIDNNVHPSNTYRVIDALIKANKRFDFILLPGQRHGYGAAADYAAWRRIDYFTQWLLGVSQDDIDMLELQREKQIKK
jgi:dipeptidyl aminopeptidase/acylaminoacyl peptidase